MIVRIAVRAGGGHELPACRTPAELAQALRNLADEILHDEIAANNAFHPVRWPRLVKNAEGGWAGHAWLSISGDDAAPSSGEEGKA
ncbi:hypothetical protein [Elioraea sp.]|uniref:hypothetical protein n=1 Tax=Elioraea sp. TaxID=2185103 RepID=UPI0021DB82BF|nr:hypothetical protein [Elioraea sp.]GIX10357.1 MAG: hypothetical protein KatS3mg116_2067 [Elioraea sp.]